MNKITISGVVYEAFSLLKASEGGLSQKDAIELLKQNGIKSKTGCYSPYVGHYGLWVEKEHSDKASNLLFG